MNLRTGQYTRGMWTGLLLTLGATGAECQTSPDRVDKSVSTYSSLMDGQPGSPGQVGLGVLASLGGGDWEGQITFEYTAEKGFFADTLFAFTFPTVQGGEGITDAETSATASWQQRWIGGNSDNTNFATLLAVQFPVHEPNQDIDFTATASLAHVIGKGVTYLNAYVETNRGPNPAPTGWGVFVGHKRPLGTKVALIGSLGYEQGAVASLGLAAQIIATEHLTVGPGVNIYTTFHGQSRRVNVSAGLVASYGF